MSLGTPNNPEDQIEEILESSELILNYLSSLRSGAIESKIADTDVDSDGNYSDKHTKDKDRVDLLGELMLLFDITAEEAEAYGDIGKYLQDKSYALQSFPYFAKNPAIQGVLDFLKREFGFIPEPIKGRSSFYEQSVVVYANTLGYPVEDIRRALTYEEFMTLDSFIAMKKMLERLG